MRSLPVTLTWLVATIFAFVLAPADPPDEIYLADGSRLVGRIEQMSGGALALSTDFAGQLNIDTAKIRGVTSARRFTIAMKDGSRAAGVPKYDPAASQQLV